MLTRHRLYAMDMTARDHADLGFYVVRLYSPDLFKPTAWGEGLFENVPKMAQNNDQSSGEQPLMSLKYVAGKDRCPMYPFYQGVSDEPGEDAQRLPQHDRRESLQFGRTPFHYMRC